MNSESRQPIEPTTRFEKRPEIQAVIKEIRSFEPEIVFDVYFGKHLTFQQGQRLSERIKRSDLVIPEYGGRTPEENQRFNRISQGEIVNVHDFPLFYRGLLTALYRTNKPVKLLDYPADDERFDELEDTAAWSYNLAGIPHLGDGYALKFAQANDQKEKDTISQLPGVLREFISENPELVQERQKNDEPLRVLIFLGAAHTRVFHALKEASPKSTRTFDEMPVQFTPFETQVREVLFDRTKTM